MSKNIIRRIDKHLARRLKEARKEVGFSVRSVASKLPRRLTVSHTTIASYENGVTVPPIDVLAALAAIYQRPVNWFLDSRESLTGFRYRNLQSRVALSDQRRYAAQAGKWAEAYFALEKHLRKSRENRWEDSEGLSPGELAHLIRTKHLDLDDSQPVMDTVAVLESFSAWAIELRANFGVDGAAASFGDKPVIILNPNIANERARLNTAHELAFVLFANDSTSLSTEVQRSAYTFASCLILPDSQLEEAFGGRSFLKLIQYKERFGVSLAAMIHRAEELRVINTTASRWLRSEMTKRGWRRQEPGYVWKDRAVSFETMLESAIQMKEITWDDAERITSIPQPELNERLLAASSPIPTDEKEEALTTLKFAR